MNFHKLISIILHPIVIPTIGVMLYFLLIPNNFNSNQKLAILGLVFTITYLVPLLILVIFKKLKLIKSFQTESIRERKIPVMLMIILFYLLASTMNNIPNLRDLGLLFFATSLGLLFIYLFFAFKIKVSIHILSLGISTGFFLVLSNIYSQNFTFLIIILLLLSGILASARLHLNAHTKKEVYLGFFIGMISPFLIYYFL
ncbi:hypothetical protein MC378_05790 [Polaribacter sp. MSW13]|uniref:PAP2 superfamily protein n=1 Tax=Polaribacter marinus TaxID=2916838 RepID=A0A9X2AIM7_9FLAO|nr:hypothetical protein [Polaribacter marinus]